MPASRDTCYYYTPPSSEQRATNANDKEEIMPGALSPTETLILRHISLFYSSVSVKSDRADWPAWLKQFDGFLAKLQSAKQENIRDWFWAEFTRKQVKNLLYHFFVNDLVAVPCVSRFLASLQA
jgi:hypothetical protein